MADTVLKIAQPIRTPKISQASTNWLKRIMQQQRCKAALFGKHHKINQLLKFFFEYPRELYETPNGVSSVGNILRTAGVTSFNAPMLDLGCGTYSDWLSNLEKLGFTDLVGVDPLIPDNQTHGHVNIMATNLSDIRKDFALITLHHSLEHIPNQRETMENIAQRLLPDGVCMIRIPVVSSYVWDRYGTDWVELDPPRHLYLHSVESITLLANEAGLDVFDIQYDSTAFEFYGSEMYSRDIPLTDANSPWVNSTSSLFLSDEMKTFTIMAKRANEEKRGGRAAFFLRKRLP